MDPETQRTLPFTGIDGLAGAVGDWLTSDQASSSLAPGDDEPREDQAP